MKDRKPHPGPGSASQLRKLFRDGRREFGRGRLARAEAVFTKARKIATAEGLKPEAGFFKACLSTAKGNWPDAVAILTPLVRRVFSLRGHAWYMLGVARARTGDPAAAIRCLKKALADKSLDTPGIAWYSLGGAYIKTGEFAAAIRCFRKALADKSFDTPGRAWNNMGIAYDGKGEFTAAIRCFRKALADKSYDTPGRAWNNIGIAYGKKNDHTAAIRCFRKALADKSYEAPGRAWNNMGIAYRKKGDPGAAIRCFEKALADKSYEARGSVWYNMAIAHSDRGEYNRALELLEKAEAAFNDAREPDNAAASRFLKQVLLDGRNAARSGHREVAVDLAGLAKSVSRGSSPKEELSPHLASMLDQVRAKEGDVYSQYARRPSSSRDDVLVMLKGWSSAIPVVSTADSDAFRGRSCRGGGYFLKARGEGIAVDPGYDFLYNLRVQGHHLREVNAVVVTHNHPDHQDDLTRLAVLDREYRKRLKPAEAGPPVRYYLDPDTNEQRRSQLRDIVKGPGSITQLQPTGPSHYALGHTRVSVFGTKHGDGQVVSEPLGCVFESEYRRGKCVKLGYTSDTCYFTRLPGHLRDCDILICHFGSAREADLLGKRRGKSHLGFMGLKELIDRTRCRLYVISEFWGGIGDIRFDLVCELKRVFADRDDFRVLAADIGLVVDLETLGVYCSRCGRVAAYDNIRMTKPSEFGPIAYLCSDCLT